MTDLLIQGPRVLTAEGPIEEGWLSVVDGIIDAVGTGGPPRAASTIDARGLTLAPGFVDVHTHGALGYETMDADPDGLRAMARFAARHGVTAMLPTTWSENRERTLAALRAVADVAGPVDGGATILGAHLEGPYLATARAGAHQAAHVRPADLDELAEWLATGVVRLITIAPEVGENLRAIEHCVRAGVTVSVGHTDATYDQVQQAVERGATQATHLCNAMRGLHHREPGVVGAVLANSGLRAEVICDGIHVHPAVVGLAARLKGAEGLVVVTDALGPVGLDPGTHWIGDREVRYEEGAMWLPERATLVGSALTFDRAARNLVTMVGGTVASLWPALSHTPAVAAGAAGSKGRIVPGLDADLVLLAPEVTVHTTIVGGRVVWTADR